MRPPPGKWNKLARGARLLAGLPRGGGTCRPHLRGVVILAAGSPSRASHRAAARPCRDDACQRQCRCARAGRIRPGLGGCLPPSRPVDLRCAGNPARSGSLIFQAERVGLSRPGPGGARSDGYRPLTGVPRMVSRGTSRASGDGRRGHQPASSEVTALDVAPASKSVPVVPANGTSVTCPLVAPHRRRRCGLKLKLDRHREPSRRAAVQVHVNLSGLRPEELERLQHGGDVPALAVTPDITGISGLHPWPLAAPMTSGPAAKDLRSALRADAVATLIAAERVPHRPGHAQGDSGFCGRQG